MHLDPWIVLAGALVGGVVGLTGMGGGALMTPVLVILFRVHPLAAVSSDLVASVFMKPVGSAVHLRRGTVNLPLVGWLAVGSVPAAFAGVFLIRALGPGVQTRVSYALGAALLLAAAGVIARAWFAARRAPATGEAIEIRRLQTVLVGAAGGLVVGMTSVGSGSLIIVMLMFLYPRLRSRQLVGSDLVQAVPMVAAAALGHLIGGDFQLGVTASIVLGGMPGVYLGARLSSQAPDRWIRPALLAVLAVSGLKLLGAADVTLLLALPVALLAAGFAVLRRRRPQPEPVTVPIA